MDIQQMLAEKSQNLQASYVGLLRKNYEIELACNSAEKGMITCKLAKLK